MIGTSGTRKAEPYRMFKKARLFTRPTPAREDAPFCWQACSSAADPRFTSHLSRFLRARARTKLADFFIILPKPQVVSCRNSYKPPPLEVNRD